MNTGLVWINELFWSKIPTNVVMKLIPFDCEILTREGEPTMTGTKSIILLRCQRTLQKKICLTQFKKPVIFSGMLPHRTETYPCLLCTLKKKPRITLNIILILTHLFNKCYWYHCFFYLSEQ